MSKARKRAIVSASCCAVFAALNFTVAVLFGHWTNYAAGSFCAALIIPNLLLDRQRKAESAMPKNNNNEYALGGYVSAPLSLSIAPVGTPPPSAPPKKTPQDFHGAPFDLAIGEVYGLRMWRMDQYGRLRARNWGNAEPWRPGVNVAKCVSKASDDAYSWFLRAAGFSPSGSSQPQSAPKPPHETPSENCQCGFYAYTDDRHAETLSYKDSHVVLGIIKGTGRTLIGTKGFRCEKAEIVALRDPTRGGTKDDPWRIQQLEDLKRVYPNIPILPSRQALLEFAPLTDTRPDPSTDEFWSLP
jgi:hypothetical protein